MSDQHSLFVYPWIVDVRSERGRQIAQTARARRIHARNLPTSLPVTLNSHRPSQRVNLRRSTMATQNCSVVRISTHSLAGPGSPREALRISCSQEKVWSTSTNNGLKNIARSSSKPHALREASESVPWMSSCSSSVANCNVWERPDPEWYATVSEGNTVAVQAAGPILFIQNC